MTWAGAKAQCEAQSGSLAVVSDHVEQGTGEFPLILLYVSVLLICSWSYIHRQTFCGIAHHGREQ